MNTVTNQQDTCPQADGDALAPAGTGWEPFSPGRAPVFPFSAWESD